ncbi:MAG: alpha/beta hydrolase [Chloroflexota bacterium]|nr:alpha/beta hydrolase [Chloroflexota bacterium]
MRKYLVAAVFMALVLWVQPSTAQTEVTPRLEAGACPVNITTERAVECGVLVMALAGEGSEVRLPVAVLSGGISAANRTPVILLTGVGDQSPFVAINGLALDALTGRDVILIEQRGGRYSASVLACPEIAGELQTMLGESLTREVEQLRIDASVEACHQRLITEGFDLSSFSIATHAADVGALMELLGYERYSVYGASYGAALAQAVIHQQPERIESVLLDSPLRTTAPVFVGAQAAVERLVAACEADAACNAAHPDLAERLSALIERLNAMPAAVDVPANNGATATQRVILTGQRLLDAIAYQMSQSDDAGNVPALIRAAEGGSYSRVAEALLAAWDATANAPLALLFSRDTPVLPVGDTPVLILRGELDPYVSQAEGGSEEEAHTFVVILPARGHRLVWRGDSCADSIAIGFLELPLSTPDVSCAQDNRVMFAFPTDATITPAVAETYNGNGFTTVVPEEWPALAPGVFGSANADLLLFLRLDGVAATNAAEAFLSRTRVEPDDVGDITIEEQAVGNYTWTVTQITFPEQDLVASIAANEVGGVSYLVILQSPTAQFETMRDSVWLSALAAFTVTG